MSSGQKAWEEEMEERAHRAHVERLEALGYSKIANEIDDVYQQVVRLEAMISALPRSGWNVIDQVKNSLGKLK